MKHFITIVLVSFYMIFSVNVLAQSSTNSVTKKADKAFELEQYHKAAELYQKAYSKTKNRALKAEIIFKQAECYRLTGSDRDAKRAEGYYKRAVSAKYPDVIVYLRYADILKKNEKYADALEQYKKYVQLNPTDVRGEKGVKSCQLAVEWKSNPTRYKIALMPIVNSRFADFSPAFGNSDYSEIYFPSSRTGSTGTEVDDRTGESFMDIYKTRQDKKGTWSSPILEMESINTGANEGSLYLNENASVMYFTRCRVEKKKQLGCEIYVSERNGKLWGEAKKLQVPIDSGVTVGHPAVSFDESTIFFSSDQPGGYGGKDLWVINKIKRNQWSEPMNLGPAINTSGDELFPFIHADGTLYFASDGHVGMGGLDIFKSTPDSNLVFTSAINLKAPINSSADDFGMIIEKTAERGYFTSNRDGGKGGDDIYQFELPPLVFSLRGVVTDTKTGAIITNAGVQLIAHDGTIIDLTTDNTGVFQQKIKPITTYEVVVTFDGYLKKKQTLTTVGIEQNKDFVLDFSLDPVVKEIKLPKIEYDLNKWNLREKSIEDLDALVITLNENPFIVIALRSHTDFRGTAEQNRILSQQRAESCVKYLIDHGIAADRLVANGIGESEPYILTKADAEQSQRGGIFTKKIFKEGDVLTETYINNLNAKYKEVAHQYNRRTTFKVISQDYVPQVKEEIKNQGVEGPSIEIKDEPKKQQKVSDKH